MWFLSSLNIIFKGDEEHKITKKNNDRFEIVGDILFSPMKMTNPDVHHEDCVFFFRWESDQCVFLLHSSGGLRKISRKIQVNLQFLWPLKAVWLTPPENEHICWKWMVGRWHFLLKWSLFTGHVNFRGVYMFFYASLGRFRMCMRWSWWWRNCCFQVSKRSFLGQLFFSYDIMYKLICT